MGSELKLERSNLQHCLGDAMKQLQQEKKEKASLLDKEEELVCHNATLKKLEMQRLVLFVMVVGLAVLVVGMWLA